MNHVLLVEDDLAICESLTLFFSGLNITVTCYSNGERILSGDYPLPDLFIMDKQLSGVDGLDLCRCIKSSARSKHIPVIMISASPAIIQQAAAAGADKALIKPFKLADLKELLQLLKKETCQTGSHNTAKK